MVVVTNNINNMPLNAYTSNEPLFLKPDGIRTRYPIGWNGYGRYIPGTLKVKYNGVDCNISEEDNGIWYNFAVAPDANTKYDDYQVSFSVRPIDYAFSTGSVEGGFPGEEYFLFPNWNNSDGDRDGFWVGKYPMSEDSNNMPVSVANATVYYTNKNAISLAYFITNSKKSSRCHLIYNREYVSIALWTDHMGIDVRGNVNGSYSTDIDNDNTNLSDVGSYYTVNGFNIITGPGPDKWNHNGLSTGIHHLVGNLAEFIDAIYMYRPNKNTYTFDIRTYIGDNYIEEISTGYTFTLLNNNTENNTLVFDGILTDDNNIINEGIPVKNSENTYYTPSNFNNSQSTLGAKNTINTNLVIYLLRGGICTFENNYQGKCNIWTTDHLYGNVQSEFVGTRLVFDLI